MRQLAHFSLQRINLFSTIFTKAIMGIRKYLARRRKDKKELEHVLPPDGGWGWIVCAAAFLIQFIVLGIMNNFGILYVKLFEDFGRKAFLTSLIGSINYGMMFLNGPIAAALAAKYGCRATSMVGSAIFSLGFLSSSYAQHIVTLYFTYGVMVGFGASLCYFSSLVAVGQYFYHKLSLANGIISSGSGIGSLVMGPVMNNLLKHLGWRVTLRVYAGMAALIFISAILYRHINTNGVQQDDGAKSREKPEKAKFIDFSIFNNKAYIIWCVALSIYILGYFVPFVHLVKYAQNNGVSADDSSFLIGIMSLGSTFGRLFFGPLSDHPKVNRLHVYQLSILCMGISNTLLPLMKTHATIVCYCLVWGTFEGCYVALCAVLTADIVGRDKLSSGVGVLFGLKSIPLTGGPALAGFIYDVSKSYDVAFYIAGAVCTLCCCIMFLIPLYMPEAGEEVVDFVISDDIEKKALEGNGFVQNGKLGNGRSDDSAYVSDQPSALVLRPRPQSSYLSPYRDKNLVVSPSTLSIRQSLSRSTGSLAHRYLEPIAKKAKSSEFGSMMSIPIIPNSGAYRSLQQIPVTTASVDLHHANHGTSTPNVNNAPQEHVVSTMEIPRIVIGDDLPDENFHSSTENVNENVNLISKLPGKETDL